MPECQYASIFTKLYVGNEFVSFINFYSYLLSVGTANTNYLNVRTISNLRNVNICTIHTTLISDFS